MWSLDPLLKMPQKLASSQARKENFWKDVHTHGNGSSGYGGDPLSPGHAPGLGVGNGKGCTHPGGSWDNSESGSRKEAKVKSSRAIDLNLPLSLSFLIFMNKSLDFTWWSGNQMR